MATQDWDHIGHFPPTRAATLGVPSNGSGSEDYRAVLLQAALNGLGLDGPAYDSSYFWDLSEEQAVVVIAAAIDFSIGNVLSTLGRESDLYVPKPAPSAETLALVRQRLPGLDSGRRAFANFDGEGAFASVSRSPQCFEMLVVLYDEERLTTVFWTEDD